MLNLTDVASGTIAVFLLAVVGCLSLLLTRNHRSGLHRQCILFLCALVIRFLLSISIYATDLHSVVVGDGDDSGWEGGLGVIRDWEYQRLGLLDLPTALLGAFEGQHRGYFYVLAIYLSIVPLRSQLAAAALSCFCGAITAVFAYRLARSLTSDRAAWRVGWCTCLFPVMIIWSCQTIKEPFVILLEVMALYGCIQLRISKFALRHLLLCGICLVVVASMRLYAAYITGLVILVSLAVPQIRRRRFSIGPAIGVAVIVIPMLFWVGSLNRAAELAGEWDRERRR